jgi:hypothetical protein
MTSEDLEHIRKLVRMLAASPNERLAALAKLEQALRRGGFDFNDLAAMIEAPRPGHAGARWPPSWNIPRETFADALAEAEEVEDWRGCKVIVRRFTYGGIRERIMHRDEVERIIGDVTPRVLSHRDNLTLGWLKDRLRTLEESRWDRSELFRFNAHVSGDGRRDRWADFAALTVAIVAQSS